MRDIVIVPCYERPEYTRVCLEYLSRARGAQDKDVWLCQDNHGGPAANEISDNMRPVAEWADQQFKFFTPFQIEAHESYGNSHNIVSCMREVFNIGVSKIFIVEDDIMVAPDFFDWHEAILREAKPFVSCATALNKSAHFQINGPQAMDESIKDPNAFKKVFGAYSSHAAAFERENLGDLLGAIDGQWELPWRSGKEQDMLIQSIMCRLTFPNAGSAWPYVPRAFNVGMYSYHINTAMKFNGTLEEKCDALRKAITSPDKLRLMSANNTAITPVPVEFVERDGPLVKR